VNSATASLWSLLDEQAEGDCRLCAGETGPFVRAGVDLVCRDCTERLVKVFRLHSLATEAVLETTRLELAERDTQNARLATEIGRLEDELNARGDELDRLRRGRDHAAIHAEQILQTGRQLREALK
jgi:hypothetical protein